MLISIEGNIGTGKSSLVRMLEEKYKYTDAIVFIQEPVNEWLNLKDTDGENILEKFINLKRGGLIHSKCMHL